MIYGIGTDIINSNRIKKIINKYNDRFINKFFGNEEIEISKTKFNKNLFFFQKDLPQRKLSGKHAHLLDWVE